MRPILGNSFKALKYRNFSCSKPRLSSARNLQRLPTNARLEPRPTWRSNGPLTLSACDSINRGAPKIGAMEGRSTFVGPPNRQDVMASRRLARRWMLRDIPQFLVLSAGIAVVFGIVGYSVDWNLVRAEFAGGGKSSFASKPNAVSRQQLNNASSTELYTGSIILVPTQGEQ